MVELEGGFWGAKLELDNVDGELVVLELDPGVMTVAGLTRKLEVLDWPTFIVLVFAVVGRLEVMVDGVPVGVEGP